MNDKDFAQTNTASAADEGEDFITFLRKIAECDDATFDKIINMLDGLIATQNASGNAPAAAPNL